MSNGQMLILEGAHKGQEYAIDRRLTIGRNRDNHIQIPHMRTSRFHAEIEARPDGLWVKDLDSTSGTFVNERPVQEQRLRHGDVVLVGNTRMQLLSPTGPGPRRGPSPPPRSRSTCAPCSPPPPPRSSWSGPMSWCAPSPWRPPSRS